MNLFSTAKPIDQKQALNALLLNQLATPGLGSLMCRRWAECAGQLLLAFAGFIGVVIWMFFFFSQQYQLMVGQPVPKSSGGWIGLVGAGLFIASWVWSGITSLHLLREAKANKLLTPAARPPVHLPPNA